MNQIGLTKTFQVIKSKGTLWYIQMCYNMAATRLDIIQREAKLVEISKHTAVFWKWSEKIFFNNYHVDVLKTDSD